MQPTDWAVPTTSLMAPESSLAKDHRHILGDDDHLIDGVISTVLMFFSFFSVSGWFLESLDVPGKGISYHLSLGLTVLNGQVVCNL